MTWQWGMGIGDRGLGYLKIGIQRPDGCRISVAYTTRRQRQVAKVRCSANMATVASCGN